MGRFVKDGDRLARQRVYQHTVPHGQQKHRPGYLQLGRYLKVGQNDVQQRRAQDKDGANDIKRQREQVAPAHDAPHPHDADQSQKATDERPGVKDPAPHRLEALFSPLDVEVSGVDGVPQTKRPVVTSGEDILLPGTISHAVHGAQVSNEGAAGIAPGHAPRFGFGVRATRQRAVTLGVEN